MKKAVTTTPMTGVATPAPTAGRPPGGGATRATGNTPPPQPVPKQSRVAPEHQTVIEEMAQAFRTQQFWQNVLAQYPSEWSRMYAKDAERAYQQARQKARAATPYFL